MGDKSDKIEVLVVDDEAAVALAIKSALKFYGYAVETVPGAEAAIRIIRENPARFPLVMSDHNMPGSTGLTLVKSLRAADYPGRVIILSAFLSNEVESQYAALGVDHILSKPFSLLLLRKALDDLLKTAAC